MKDINTGEKTDEELQALADSIGSGALREAQISNPLREFIKRNSGELKEMMLESKSGVIVEPKRNDLCRCGSGKKYKKCCGIDK